MQITRPGIPELPPPYEEQAYKLFWNDKAEPPNHEWSRIISPVISPENDKHPIVIRSLPDCRVFYANAAARDFGILPDNERA